MLVEPLLLAAALWGPATVASAPAADDPDKAKAVEYSKRGLEAARREEYQEAIELFETALALRPSARLYYNIAVSYHRIYAALPEGDLNRREEARSKAVDAYNEYLQAAPEAADRDEVGRTVLKLGGRPASLDDWSIEESGPAADPDQTPDLREDPEAAGDKPPPEPVKPPPKVPETKRVPIPPYRRGRFGLALGVMSANLARFRNNDDVATLPYVSGLLRGGAFMGARRRLNVGGELSFSGQPTSSDARHFLTAFAANFAFEYGEPVGPSQRVEIGGGGVSGFFVEQLRHNGTTTVTCAQSSGVPSSRGGFLLAGRFNLVFLLGKNNRHELGLRLTPGLGLATDGNKSSDDDPLDCADQPDPFRQLELNGPELVVTFDIGYAPRF